MNTTRLQFLWSWLLWNRYRILYGLYVIGFVLFFIVDVNIQTNPGVFTSPFFPLFLFRALGSIQMQTSWGLPAIFRHVFGASILLTQLLFVFGVSSAALNSRPRFGSFVVPFIALALFFSVPCLGFSIMMVKLGGWPLPAGLLLACMFIRAPLTGAGLLKRVINLIGFSGLLIWCMLIIGPGTPELQFSLLSFLYVPQAILWSVGAWLLMQCRLRP